MFTFYWEYVIVGDSGGVLMSKKLFLLCLLFLVACEKGDDDVMVVVEVTRPGTPTSTPSPTSTSTPTPWSSVTPRIPTATSTPEPKTDLVVCMGREPYSLFGQDIDYSHGVFHALYENLYTYLSYEYQPQGLEAIPSLADGSARLAEVVVERGDTVVDMEGNVGALSDGMVLWHPAGDPITFTGDPITIYQLEVDFTFKPLVWEDGQPVTADDSVYAFELASDPQVWEQSWLVTNTASYTATDDLSVRWVGLPGYRNTDYFLNVFRPLPRHAWGHMSVEELLESDVVNRAPLSNGPFRMVEWVDGSHITLEKNPHYYRAHEGLPKVDRLTLLFPEEELDAIIALVSGECDMTSPNLTRLEGASIGIVGAFTLHRQPGATWDYLALGINSAGEYGDGIGRPDWFEDKRARQAMAMCINRESISANVAFGSAENLVDAYVPSSHALMPADGRVWEFDPAGGNALLDEIGYLDTDDDGIREDPLTDQPFEVNYIRYPSESSQQIGQIIQEYLIACGISIQFDNQTYSLADGPAIEQYREFDLSRIIELFYIEPACHTYLSEEVGIGYGVENISGWQNADFDVACHRAMLSLPGLPGYVESHQEALRIFMDELPVIPLFSLERIVFSHHYVKNVKLNPSQPSVLWNVYEIEVLPDAVEE